MPVNTQHIVIVLMSMTVGVVITMIMSIVLCLKRKKNLKKKDLNSVQKTVISENKEKIKKDLTKSEFMKKENLLASNHPAGEIKDRKSDKEKKKTDSNQNVSSNQHGLSGKVDHDNEVFDTTVTELMSAKNKQEEAGEKDKKEKTEEGFYQSRSDEDDTLEQIKSLKEEQTDPVDKTKSSKKIRKMKNTSHRSRKLRNELMKVVKNK